jgi:hypothetical protein
MDRGARDMTVARIRTALDETLWGPGIGPFRSWTGVRAT